MAGIFETLGIALPDRVLLYSGVALVAVVAFDSLIEKQDREYGKRVPRRDTGAIEAPKARRKREPTTAQVSAAEERLRKLEERAEAAKERAQEWEKVAKAAEGRGATKTAKKAREVAEKAAGDAIKVEDTADRLESIIDKSNKGQRLTPHEAEQLRQAMAGGRLAMKRNPRNRANPAVAVNPTDPELAKAMRISEQFHGTPGEVVELSERERTLPRYAVLLGSIPELKYIPDEQSERGGAEWVHEAGDRGFGAPKSNKKPLLAVDPRTGRPLLVQGQSPMRLNSSRGLIG